MCAKIGFSFVVFVMLNIVVLNRASDSDEVLTEELEEILKEDDSARAFQEIFATRDVGSYDVLEKAKQDIYQKMEYDLKILRDGKEDVVVTYNTNFYTAVAGEKFDDYGSGERN